MIGRAVVEMFSVDVPGLVLGSVTVGDVKLAVAPVGRPETESEMFAG